MLMIVASGSEGDIDLLQVDVEGFNYEILKMVGFEKIKPVVINYEYSKLSINDLTHSKPLLREKNYYLFTAGDDMIGVLLSKISF